MLCETAAKSPACSAAVYVVSPTEHSQLVEPSVSILCRYCKGTLHVIPYHIWEIFEYLRLSKFGSPCSALMALRATEGSTEEGSKLTLLLVAVHGGVIETVFPFRRLSLIEKISINILFPLKPYHRKNIYLRYCSNIEEDMSCRISSGNVLQIVA